MVPTTKVHSSPSLLLLLILLLAIYHHRHHPVLARRPVETENEDGFCFKFRVHVINGLSSNANPLFLRCWSLDDDLGEHHLYIGGDFNFKFGLKVFGRTLFTCFFEWDNKNQHVDVFRDNVEANLCCDTQTCFWRAQDEGIFFSVDSQTWDKKFNWTSSVV
ncbi:S-protein homolog 2 [Ricinus communis]|uniref:S-protein homolog n=1 Tax=Ricinus communis TaxID=3988 RepID=B9SD57_RICCO|nr:S-protein homolog 2 [Ricinus communis]EEF38495.1 conserved hypothetical protein [Ricinus communis]|eukprot:XP_002523926.1 S-protein homolog 2 [Ricinus communis]